jgi:hypothetical protein
MLIRCWQISRTGAKFYVAVKSFVAVPELINEKYRYREMNEAAKPILF